MKALLLAAGLGTRLRPLTDDRPKALVAVGGQTLLERNIRFLKSKGVSEIIVNIHHFGEQIVSFVRQHDFGLPVRISDERDLLRDTGGAIRHAAPFFSGEEDFLVYNVDVLSDISLKKLYDAHKRQRNLATMAVRHRQSERQLLFGSDLRLVGRYSPDDAAAREPGMHIAAFSGIHLLSTRIFNMLPEEERFPILPVYLELTRNEGIRGFFHDDSGWMDMGRPEHIAAWEAQHKQ